MGLAPSGKAVQVNDHDPLAVVLLPARLVRRTLREAAGLTLTDVGRLVDPEHPVDRSVVSRWERTTDPTGDRRRAYAAVLRQIDQVAV